MALGFGNSYTDILFSGNNTGQNYADVLTPQPLRWSPFDPESCDLLLHCLGLIERIKIEVNKLTLS